MLVLGASNLDIDLLPSLYEALCRIGHVERLDVVVYCRGGEVNAARRMALLFHEFTNHLSFIVPHHCESAGTVMALAGTEIVAGSLALFSPIDPLLNASDSSRESAPDALSSQDIRLFWKMSQDWFGLEERQARARSLTLLCESIFPTTLTSFYRCTLELRNIGDELLALHMSDRPEVRKKIVEALIFDFHSHGYAITRDELRNLGLPVKTHGSVEHAAWAIACEIRTFMGPESRMSLDDDWHDSVIATREGGMRRRRIRNAPASIWDAIDTK